MEEASLTPRAGTPADEPRPLTPAEKKRAKKARQKARQRAAKAAEGSAAAGDAAAAASPAPAPAPAAAAAATAASEPAAINPCGVPSPRLYFSLVSTGEDDSALLVLFGGELTTGKGRKARMQYYKETFIFAAATRAWYKVDTAAASPRARSGHHAALVHGAGESRTMYMFGGEYGNAKGTSFTHLKCACPHLAVAGPTTTSR